MINWPDYLVKDIARRRCVIYLGSGVSHNSENAEGDHPMTWRAFLEDSVGKSNLSTDQKEEVKSGTACLTLGFTKATNS